MEATTRVFAGDLQLMSSISKAIKGGHLITNDTQTHRLINRNSICNKDLTFKCHLPV